MPNEFTHRDDSPIAEVLKHHAGGERPPETGTATPTRAPPSTPAPPLPDSYAEAATKGAQMPYNESRLVHDADAHIMETPTWLRDHAEAAYRDRLPALSYPGGNELRQTGSPEEQQHDLVASFDRLAERHHSDEYLATE